MERHIKQALGGSFQALLDRLDYLEAKAEQDLENKTFLTRRVRELEEDLREERQTKYDARGWRATGILFIMLSSVLGALLVSLT